ncbi:MAG TPA: lysophospholipid acyltransferase family protein [Actinomycetota bacterium]|nr:lysophospholipid acyltransferase family protein [Actinomycetota bacterium]
MEPVYRPVIGLALTLFKTMGWQVALNGLENIPIEGPAVIATNHVGYLDFVFVGYAAHKRKRLVRFMAKKEVFEHPVAGPLMRGMKHIPADRFGKAELAIERSIEALKNGEIVGMFPEGTISRSFIPRTGKTGAVRIAMEAGAPLIPGVVWGTQRILTKGRPKNFERKVAMSVDIDRPLPYEPVDDPTTVTERLMTRITEMVGAAERNYPQNPAVPSGEFWLPAHMGGGAPTLEEADALAAKEKAERAARSAARKAQA